MKKYIITSLVLLAAYAANAQTYIERHGTGETSVVLDFNSDVAGNKVQGSGANTKGIILPAVEALPATPANGTFVFDRNDRKVKVHENGVWKELSDEGELTGLVPWSGTVDNGRQTVIGARETAVAGVLVLESADKAMVLPRVASPHLNVKSPYPGMMCYDTDSKTLAVFDGSVWNYWR